MNTTAGKSEARRNLPGHKASPQCSFDILDGRSRAILLLVRIPFPLTYATNTVAFKAFDTPSMESVAGIADGDKVYKSKNILLGDSVLIVSHGSALAQGVEAGGIFYPASTVVVNGNDTIVSDHHIVNDENGYAKLSFNKPLSQISSLSIDGRSVPDFSNAKVVDYLSRLQGPVTLTEAAIVAEGKTDSYDLKTLRAIR